MAERKWASPRLFALYEGDRFAAKRLERRARICVGYLFDQLRPGQTYRTQTWNYEGGSRIKVYVWRDVLGERARVEIFVPYTSTLLTSEFFTLEHGWNRSHKIYIPEDLSNYYAGTGTSTALICDVEQDYMYIYGQSKTANEDAATCFIWPEDPPTIANNAHDTLLVLPDGSFLEDRPRNNPWTATGQLRKIAQAFSGAGKDIIATLMEPLGFYVFDSNWPNLSRYGVITGPDGTFWGINLSQLGCSLKKLEVSQAELAAFIDNAEWPDTFSQNLAEQYYLASLRYAGVGIPITTADDAEVTIDDVYEGGAMPFAHGWHWHDTDPIGAIVVRRFISIPFSGASLICYETAQFKCEIVFEENEDSPDFGTPLELVITKEWDWTKFLPDQRKHKCWAAFENYSDWIEMFIRQNDGVTAWMPLFEDPAPVYCLWKRDGELHTIWYEPAAQEKIPVIQLSFTATQPQSCGGGSAEQILESEDDGSGVILTGGFRNVELPERLVYGLSFVRRSRGWTSGSGGAGATKINAFGQSVDRPLVRTMLSDISCSGSASAALQFIEEAWADSDAGLLFVSAFGMWAGGGYPISGYTKTENFVNRVEFTNFFLTADPTVVYAVHREQADVVSGVEYDYTINNRLMTTVGAWYRLQSGEEVFSDGESARAMFAAGYGFQADISNAFTFISLAAADQNHATNFELAPSYSHVYIVSKEGTMSLDDEVGYQDFTQWAACDYEPPFEPEWLLRPFAAFGPNLAYQPSPNRSYLGVPGLTDSGIINRSKQWVGGV